jgi:hypothetical protein
MTTPVNAAEALNRSCDCTLTDESALRARFDTNILETHPHLFSAAPVFISREHADAMRATVAAIEEVAPLPLYQAAVLAQAPAIAATGPHTSGVFAGFDFHITAEGPRLIEINTNAGGAFLNLAAHSARRSCCPVADELIAAQPSCDDIGREILAMFAHEWQAVRGARKLESIAIVDDEPASQYLYPEFVLARKFFAAHGLTAVIADPAELSLEGEALTVRGQRIDLVYNRLTDFYLEEPRHAVLREAHERGLMVLTPHPRAHALYANKRNLALLGDAAALSAAGAGSRTIDTLQRAIPQTRLVEGDAETWWQDRKRWFFKPTQGFGSRGTYRGDKLTRRVFGEIMQGQYIAQELTPPSERWRGAAEAREIYKVDVRCYAHAGQVQFMAARLYQGQTTNFRTAGGGFAAVYEWNTATAEAAA